MDEPNYVLSTNEAVLVPKDDSKLRRMSSKVTWVVVAIIIVGSLAFRKNLFLEMSRGPQVLLVVIVLSSLINRGKEETPSPVELQFYDDYFVLYAPKRYYSTGYRRTYDKMYYSEVTKCTYKSKSKRLHFEGTLHAKWFRYDKEGTLANEPFCNKTVEGTMCYISTRCAPQVDFVKEIESHSPLRVVVEDF